MLHIHADSHVAHGEVLSKRDFSIEHSEEGGNLIC